MHELKMWVLKPLTLIGAINWGLIGLFGFDIVSWIFGMGTMATRIVYVVIGIAALIWAILIFADKK